MIRVTSFTTDTDDEIWLNQTFSVELAEEVFDAPSHGPSDESSENTLDLQTMYNMIRSFYYLERLKKEMLASLLAAIVMVIFLVIIRIIVRRLRRSSSAYFTVHKEMALAYVRSDIPEDEMPQNTCTSFIIRGYE
jgi:hypothetical protein